MDAFLRLLRMKIAPCPPFHRRERSRPAEEKTASFYRPISHVRRSDCRVIRGVHSGHSHYLPLPACLPACLPADGPDSLVLTAQMSTALSGRVIRLLLGCCMGCMLKAGAGRQCSGSPLVWPPRRSRERDLQDWSPSVLQAFSGRQLLCRCVGVDRYMASALVMTWKGPVNHLCWRQKSRNRRCGQGGKLRVCWAAKGRGKVHYELVKRYLTALS